MLGEPQRTRIASVAGSPRLQLGGGAGLEGASEIGGLPSHRYRGSRLSLEGMVPFECGAKNTKRALQGGRRRAGGCGVTEAQTSGRSALLTPLCLQRTQRNQVPRAACARELKKVCRTHGRAGWRARDPVPCLSRSHAWPGAAEEKSSEAPGSTAAPRQLGHGPRAVQALQAGHRARAREGRPGSPHPTTLRLVTSVLAPRDRSHRPGCVSRLPE